MPTYHYVENQEKLIMQSRENGQKLQFGQFFDDFEVKYLQIANFSEKQVSFKLKVIFSINLGQKPKKSLEPVLRKISKCLILGQFGGLFANISKSIFSFKNAVLSLFYLYSPLTSCKKSEKSLELFLSKLSYQPTNQLLPPTSILQDLTVIQIYFTEYKFVLVE